MLIITTPTINEKMIDQEISRYVKQYDYDRYICSIFAPEKIRVDFHVLYAFNIEISKISELTSETTTGLFRLQWWKDIIDKIYNNVRTEHYIANPLFDVIHKYNLSRQLLDELIDSREFDIYNTPPKDIEELISYVKHSSANLNLLSLEILQNTKKDQIEMASNLGIAWGIIGNLRSTKYINNLNKPLIFPNDLLDRYGLSQEKIKAGENLDSCKPIISYLLEISKTKINFEINKIDNNHRFIFLPKIISSIIINKIEDNDYDIFNSEFEYTKFTTLIKLYWNML